MRYLYLSLISIICWNCTSSESETAVVFQTDRSYDSIALYQIEGNDAIRLGSMSGTSDWRLKQPLDKPGVFKMFQYNAADRSSVLFILTDEASITLNESAGELNVENSYETQRLMTITQLLEQCDSRHFGYQRKLVEFASDPDSINHYYRLTEENQSTCYSDLKQIVRNDYASVASLYALNYIDPAKNFSLMDSVICQTKEKYPSIYLLEEIITIHQLNKTELQCY